VINLKVDLFCDGGNKNTNNTFTQTDAIIITLHYIGAFIIDFGLACTLRAGLRAGLDQKILQNDTVTSFVVIWQLVSNHGVIRLKRFVSSISSKLCN
jgi:hypothetical protein